MKASSSVPLVTNGVENLNLVKNSAVIEGNGQGIADRSRVWVVIISGEELVFDALHL